MQQPYYFVSGFCCGWPCWGFMSFMKDWEVWENYKNGIERLDGAERTVLAPPKLNFFPKKRMLVCAGIDSSNFNVRNLEKSEMRRWKSERTIDLHGKTREISGILDEFCMDCIARKIKFVTIITGKGAGILKDAVNFWIMSRPDLVVAYAPIMDSMNQSGAVAVKLRMRK